MKQDEELWMKKLTEMLEDYSEKVPADGWARLERELSPSKRIYPYKWWGIAAAILLLTICSVSLFFLQTDVADTIRETSVPVLVSADDLPELPDVDVLNPVSQHDVLAVQRPAQARTTPFVPAVDTNEPVTTVTDTGAVQEATPQDKTDPVMDDKTETTQKKQPVSADNDTNDKAIARPSGRDKYHLPVGGATKKKSSGWAIGLNVNSMAAATSNSQSDFNGNPGFLANNVVSFPELSHELSNGILDLSDQQLIYKDGVPLLTTVDKVEEAKHRQPISVGLSLRKGLGNRFSVEAGVMYTLLSSDIKMSNQNEWFEQKLHYIGIPVKANWDFIDSKNFTLYASAGGAVEKCVYGKQGSTKKTVDELQFSLLGAVGAQYNASRKIGVFIEPGVSYYFDDGSKVETIRKDKPFNISLQAGIRLRY